MKKFSHYIFLSCLLAFSIVVNAQKPTEVTREAAELMNKGNIRGAIAVLDKGIEKKKDLFEVYRMRSFLRPMIGDFNGALNDLSSAIEIKPDSAALYEQRAMMRLNLRQDWSLIIKDLDSAISYGRKLEKIYALRASVRHEMGDEEGAISDYQTAIGLRPDYAQAHVGLASVYLSKRDDDKAISIYEQFLQTYENSNGKLPKVKGELVAESSIQIPNENLPKGIIQGQQIVIIRGIEGKRMPNSPEDAEKMSDKLEQSKNIALAYANLGSFYERKGEIEKALAAIEKALAIDPSDFVAHNTRGKIKIKQNDLDGAISDFNRVIKTMPGMPDSYLGRGIAFLLQGKEAEAQKDFDKYLQIFPNGKMSLEKRIEEAKQKLQK